MKPNTLRILLPFLFLLGWVVMVMELTHPVFAATCTWTGASTTAWENPGNWIGCSGLIPAGGDDVIIPDVANDPVLNLTRTVNQVAIETGGVLSVASGVTLTVSVLDLTGTLRGDGDVAISAQMDWHPGSVMTGSGRTLIEDGATLYLDEAGGVDLNGRTLENQGDFVWTAAASGPTIFGSNGAQFWNNATGSVIATAINSNLSYIDLTSPAAFLNDGYFGVTTGNGMGVKMETRFQNDGDVAVTGDGGFTISLGSTNSGGMLSDESATIFVGDTNYPGQDFTFTSSSQLTVWQIVFLSPGTINIDGGYSAGGIDSKTTINGQSGGGTTVNFNPGALVTSLGDEVYISYGILNLNFGGTMMIPTLRQTLGTVEGDTDLQIGSDHNWIAGTLRGSGDFTLQPSATQRLAANQNHYLDGRTITNNGTIEWLANGDFYLSNGAEIDNYGTLDARGDDDLIGGTSGVLNNFGLLLKTAGPLTTTIGTTFTNQGNIRNESGQFAFTLSDLVILEGQSLELGGGALTAPSPVELQGGTLIGSGAIAGDLVNNGAVSPGNSAGAITINGNYTQTMTGTLALELGQFEQDLFEIQGTAEFSGTLDVTFLVSGDEGPPIGTEIPLLSYGAFSGNFDAILLPAMENKGWSYRFETNEMLLTVTEAAIANLTASNNGPVEAGEVITLTAEIDAGSGVTYQWEFGDDSATVAGKVVTYTYTIPGVYTATVTATNTLGSMEATTIVTIVEDEYFVFIPLAMKP